ncbi:hypothetical protein NKG94_37775 [Micromonospora sp. M12]
MGADCAPGRQPARWRACRRMRRVPPRRGPPRDRARSPSPGVDDRRPRHLPSVPQGRTVLAAVGATTSRDCCCSSSTPSSSTWTASRLPGSVGSVLTVKDAPVLSTPSGLG